MTKAKTQTRRTYERPRILVLGNSGGAVEVGGADAAQIGYTDDRAVAAVRHENIHGLLLTGGSDIDPSLYDAARHPRTQAPFPERDLVELYAVQAAFERGIPVLGICRGAQMINVASGGTLHQHLPDVDGSHRWHDSGKHRIRTAEGSRVRKAAGAEPWVVSLHHQAVDLLADGFVATAWALDGTVEAIESVEGWVVGVQFHPELDLGSSGMRAIFHEFAKACAKGAGLAAPRRKALTPVRAAKTARTPERVPASWRTSTAHWSDTLDLTERDAAPSTGSGKVHRYWHCFRCGIDFDDPSPERAQEDYDDHMYFLHDVDVTLGGPFQP